MPLLWGLGNSWLWIEIVVCDNWRPSTLPQTSLNASCSDVLMKHDVTLRGMWCGGFAWRPVSSIPATYYRKVESKSVWSTTGYGDKVMGWFVVQSVLQHTSFLAVHKIKCCNKVSTNKTRMHSSRMRTARLGCRRGRVSAQGGMSVCLGRCTPHPTPVNRMTDRQV